jgi:alpha-D-ribose 1-methylphosphonate 5-triphosphate synthase subunit PhnL
LSHNNYIVPQAGETRLCIDPWNKVFIRADAGVCMCCNSGPVGSLKDNTLDTILNNDKIKQYRIGLLTGALMPDCLKCPDREVVNIDKQTTLVKNWLDT